MLASSAFAATARIEAGVLEIRAGLIAGTIEVYEISPNVVVRNNPDSAGGMDARSGCAQVTANKVRCPRSAITSIRADLSSGIDIFSAAPGRVVDDGLHNGTSLPTTINGDAGRDFLFGGRGRDSFNGGLGDDSMIGGLAADAFDGGSGNDSVSYADRDDSGPGATVILDGLVGDGAAGENDFIAANVEDAIGTAFADTITGNSGNNELRAQNSSANAKGSDTIRGLGGNDSIDARGGKPDTVSCGAGSDSAQFDLVDLLPTDCEDMSQAAVGQHPNVNINRRATVLRRGRALRVGLKCPRKSRRRCRGTLTLRDAGGRRLGGKRFSIRRGGSSRPSVSLSRRGTRSVLHRARITAVAKERDTNRRPKTTIARLRLR